MAIQWTADLSTHDPSIDEQHQQIFRFVNKLEALVDDADPDLTELDSLLAFLDTYAQNHFRYEEACMLKRRCPVAQRNRSEHIAFKAFLDRALDSYQTNGYTQDWANQLLKKLETWLTQHICRLDLQLRNYPGKAERKKKRPSSSNSPSSK